MARPETLVPGNCYFSVGFHDQEMRLPIIQTLVFVDAAGSWSSPSGRTSIAALCRRVLLEVCGIRRGDVLDYHPLRRADVSRRD